MDASSSLCDTDCVALSGSLRWQIASMQLSVMRLPHEWQIAIHGNNHHGTDFDETRFALIRGKPFTGNEGKLNRCAFAAAEDNLKVMPQLAGRSVTVKPAEPFNVPSGQTTTIYVSSPLWMQLEVHEPAIKLQESPIQRPSDA